VSTRSPCASASRRQSARILATFGTVAGLLWAQTAPALAGAMEKGATQRMRQNRTNFIYNCLSSERQISELKTFVQADAALPERTVLEPTERRNEPTVRIAVHQRGPGTNNCILVMIHGILANHDSWRYLTGPLSSDFDLWIIDLPGCGDSDKPDPEALAGDGYSPGAIADRVMQAVEQCLTNRNDSPRLVLVAHSLGGMIALRMTGDLELRRRHARLLRQVDGLVLFAPGDVNVNQASQVFTTIAQLGSGKVVIGDLLGIVREATAKSTLNGFASPRLATTETADQLHHILTHANERRAAQAMIKQAVPWKFKENRPDWHPIHELEKNYSNVDKPCLIVWGECDEVLPESMGYKLAAQIAGAKLVVLHDCMHSIELERPDDCVRLIRDFQATVQVARRQTAPLPAETKTADDFFAHLD
jgi:pimeloyl-ACP methyl ester carboxylesterase